MRSFGKIQIRIFDPKSLGSWCIKGTDKSTLGKDSSFPLMHHDPSDFVSKIRISQTNAPLIEARIQAILSIATLSSAEAPLRKGSAGVKFRGRRRREPLPETTPNMAAIRGSHFVTRVVCVLMS